MLAAPPAGEDDADDRSPAAYNLAVLLDKHGVADAERPRELVERAAGWGFGPAKEMLREREAAGRADAGE